MHFSFERNSGPLPWSIRNNRSRCERYTTRKVFYETSTVPSARDGPSFFHSTILHDLSCQTPSLQRLQHDQSVRLPALSSVEMSTLLSPHCPDPLRGTASDGRRPLRVPVLPIDPSQLPTRFARHPPALRKNAFPQPSTAGPIDSEDAALPTPHPLRARSAPPGLNPGESVS